ncbi:MAG: tRNA pseudouridine(38-40) synthase TruA, partial [Dehalococcoidales bacterium]|nr:tRNA pseudouridine(38-40) synthase TruA [Dehalococcoidales bacterium]
MTTRMVLIIEYVGTRYYGFQLQASLPTVQSEIEKALHKLTGESSRVMAASRTDTGVHARGQVVSFRTESPLPVERFVAGVNYYLPADIAVKAAYKVPVAFNVRREAISREYSYHILSSDTRSPLRVAFSYRVRGQLNIEAMNRACLALVGEHDFISFASALEKGKSTVRRVYQAKVEKHKDLVVFSIVANSFLPHQVRNTVGALIRVGLSRMMVDEFCSIIDERKPGLAGPCVPACG